MKIIGIIAEYNPFHNGHLYQINKIKERYPNSILIGVVSSSFTQRGDISILNKWDKTKVALDNGLDLVVELPFVYATQSSDIFAKGAIDILNKLKIDTLVFGTESDNIDKINELADIQINNKEYNDKVKEYLDTGFNYPTSLNKALEDFSQYKVETPNDLLALSYIKEIKRNNYNIEVINIKRTTSYHGEDIKENITSASNIRKLYLEGKDISKLIPYSQDILYKINMNNCFNYMKYKIITEESNLNKYQTVDEGIENRIIKIINSSNNYEELIQNIKTKRYTYNKISRMLLHMLTSFTKEEASNLTIDYIRILGFTTNGKRYLNKIKKDIEVPIITRYKKGISKVFDIELRITKIYDIITKNNEVDKEYKSIPLIKD